jgi:hypothetical protein
MRYAFILGFEALSSVRGFIPSGLYPFGAFVKKDSESPLFYFPTNGVTQNFHNSCAAEIEVQRAFF